jgi:hypothetical protein
MQWLCMNVPAARLTTAVDELHWLLAGGTAEGNTLDTAFAATTDEEAAGCDGRAPLNQVFRLSSYSLHRATSSYLQR